MGRGQFVASHEKSSTGRYASIRCAGRSRDQSAVVHIRAQGRGGVASGGAGGEAAASHTIGESGAEIDSQFGAGQAGRIGVVESGSVERRRILLDSFIARIRRTNRGLSVGVLENAGEVRDGWNTVSACGGLEAEEIPEIEQREQAQPAELPIDLQAQRPLKNLEDQPHGAGCAIGLRGALRLQLRDRSVEVVQMSWVLRIADLSQIAFLAGGVRNNPAKVGVLKGRVCSGATLSRNRAKEGNEDQESGHLK